MNKIDRLRQDILCMYYAALKRVDGYRCVRAALEQEPLPEEISLVALGTAASAMARGALDELGDRIVEGLVITRAGYLDPGLGADQRLVVMEGGYPLPDEGSLAAGEALTAFVCRQPAARRLLFLVSGGASSVAEQLRPGLTLDDLRRADRWLLGSGLNIQGINRVRRALSCIKGGGLLRFTAGRPVIVLMISDVAGDNPALIGSGLLSRAEGPRADDVDGELPEWLRAMMAAGGEVSIPSAEVNTKIVATLTHAREAAAQEAKSLGYGVNVSHAMINADAENCGRRLGLELLDAWPGVYVWGGEPAVSLPETPGRGGPNQHLALAAAIVMEGRDDVCLLSAATDGTDGPVEDAGALVDGGTLGRARRQGFDGTDWLVRADAGTLLEAAGDLVRTGPTGTGVMGIMIGARL